MYTFNFIDVDEMKAIHDGSFPLPDLSNPLYIIQKMVVESGSIAAIGIVRLTSEGILLVNNSLPAVTRARVSTELISQLKTSAKSRGLDECHAFVKCPRVQKFLEHIGFKECQGGTPLVIHF